MLQRVVARYVRSRSSWASPEQRVLVVTAPHDLYPGCLLWGAVGDALGRPAERGDPAELLRRYGPDGLAHYHPWRGYRGGPVGTITDDTQLTMELARSLIATRGDFDPADFARRLVAWLPIGRGKGRATTQAVQALAGGAPWWEAGLEANSASNGAAMRASPLGLLWALAPTPDELVRDAVLSAVPTHTHRVGVAGAVVIAAGVAWCVREALRGTTELDPHACLAFAAQAIEGMEREPTMERRPGGRPVRLAERVREVKELLTWPDPAAVFRHTWNGAYALESVPAALYCFLRSPGDPRQVLLTAVYAGHDADTVAAMAGNLVGAWVGAERLRTGEPEWWADLEYRDELIALADALAEFAVGKAQGY
ncbi:MAG: ADP-ribosylglycohydrolase family protein [Chloroflexi bacterium]|nr:ADP-ribosylglycohydrolase family protein [Chloroflexota bacterium]